MIGFDKDEGRCIEKLSNICLVSDLSIYCYFLLKSLLKLLRFHRHCLQVWYLVLLMGGAHCHSLFLERIRKIRSGVVGRFTHSVQNHVITSMRQHMEREPRCCVFFLSQNLSVSYKGIMVVFV